MKCIECPDYKECVLKNNLKIKRRSCPKAKKPKKTTRYDRIKNMSLDEMVLFLHGIDHEGYGFIRIGGETLCNEDLKKWLESEERV